MRYILLVILTGLVPELQASENFSASLIPASLMKHANVVKRLETIDLQISSATSSRITHRYVLTILNENGDPHALFREYYDRFRRIESIEGYLYDAQGRLLKKVKTRDFTDQSAISDISLMEDDRVKLHNFFYRGYPYTVEYRVTIFVGQTFYMPTWVPQSATGMAVEKGMLSVTAPQDYQLRYRAFNYAGEPRSETGKKTKSLSWQVMGLPAIRHEFALPDWHELTPVVRLAPVEFEVAGFKGSMESWREFGRFINTLNKDRDKLPQPLKIKVAEVVAGASDDREKVEKLYAYLQQNTRYISIQMGIGGWQPFDAEYVFRKGYGDCKALSNYMYSLLKEAGIRSHYALIQAGNDRNILEDFPSTQFNHAILCVPMDKDTIWLECTSQTKSPGYMGDFTGNRKALIIDENGGTVVSTPSYGIYENTRKRRIVASVNSEGSLSMKVNTVYRAQQQDDISMLIDALSREKVRKYLQEHLELATYDVNDFSYITRKGLIPEVEEDLDITVRNYATISGKRLFIVPNIMNRGGMQITSNPDRKADFVFRYEYRDEDEEEIIIPEGYEIESMPPPTGIRSRYGSYSSSVSVEGNRIIYKRVREHYRGRFPASEQQDIINFYQEIYRADRARVVLVKKN